MLVAVLTDGRDSGALEVDVAAWILGTISILGASSAARRPSERRSVVKQAKGSRERRFDTARVGSALSGVLGLQRTWRGLVHSLLTPL